MIAALAPIGALLLSVALLLVGNGLHGTLVPVRANIEAFSAASIGLIGSGYFVGFVLGCLWCPLIVQRVGHIRSFAALAALASALALSHPLLTHPLTWIVLRAVTGFCFAGLYTVIESWLNEKASNENRGQVLSVYQIVNLGALTCGQFLLITADPAGYPLFSIVAILIALSVLPVSVGATQAPLPIAQVKIRLRWLYATSPVGVFGCFAVGLANGAFWTLAPVFARESGLSVPQIAEFMAITILGGAAFQYPLGRLSDRIDRRRVIAGVCVAGALIAVGLVAASLLQWTVLLPLAFVFGGFAFPLYALCLAHANDFATADHFFSVSGGLLLTYGIGAIVGPAAASFAMQLTAPAALYGFTAAVHLGVALLVIGRIRKRMPVPAAEKEHFRAVPRTTPTALALDPRNPADTGAPATGGEKPKSSQKSGDPDDAHRA